MKIKISTVYLVLLVLGVIVTGFLTGIYGTSISMWISYGFLALYGIMILVNALTIDQISKLKIETTDEELTPEQIKNLPDGLGEGKKVGETTLQEIDAPPKPPSEIKEEKGLTEEEIKIVEKIGNYIKDNLEKGHKIEIIRVPLDKVYGPKAVDWVLQNAIKIKEPELPDLGEPQLPDLGEPEEVVTPETLGKEIKKPKKKTGRPKKKKVEIVNPE